MPRRRTRKKGGASIIGQGAYGCVYRPALACEGNSGQRQGQVSKLVSKRNVEEEYVSYDILRTIDPGRELYAYPMELCPFHAASQTPESLGTLLTPAEKAALTPNPLISTRNNYARIDAIKTDYRRHGKKCAITNANEGSIIQMPDAGSTFNQLKLSKGDVYGFFEGFATILQGVKVLHEAGYFHHDIKPDNILIQRAGAGSFKFRLADFGSMRSLAKSLETYKKGGYVNRIYHSPYPFWPLYTVFLNIGTHDLIHFLNGVGKYKTGMEPHEKKVVDYVIKANLRVAAELGDRQIAEPAYSMYKNGNRQSIDDLEDIRINVYQIFYEKIMKSSRQDSDSHFTNFLQNIDIYSLAITLNLYVNSIFNSICLYNLKNKDTHSVAYKYGSNYLYFSDYYRRISDTGYASWLHVFTADIVIGLYDIVIKFMNTSTFHNLLPIDEFLADYMAVIGKFKKLLENDTNQYYARFMKDIRPMKIKLTPTPVPDPVEAANPVYSPNVNNIKTKKRGRNNQPQNQNRNQKQQKINQTPSHNSQGYSAQALTQEPFFPMNNQIL